MGSRPRFAATEWRMCMGTTLPIKDKERLEMMKNYYRDMKGNPRNYLLVVTSMNTALRISDILTLKWKDVYSVSQRRYKSHITLREQKTGKNNTLLLNQAVIDALEHYAAGKSLSEEQYLFQSQKGENMPITRQQAFRIVRKAALFAGLEEHISCHSLRKTFGYYAWKQGTSPALLMKIYNHSSFQVTQRYLGIDQEEKDNVYLNVVL